MKMISKRTEMRLMVTVGVFSIIFVVIPIRHRVHFYACPLFSARQHAERAICYRPSVRLSVCLSVCLSVRHTGGSVKNG